MKAAGEPTRMLTIPEVAGILGVAPHTLRHWRSKGVGPRYVRLSPGGIRYRREEAEAWVGRVPKTPIGDPRKVDLYILSRWHGPGVEPEFLGVFDLDEDDEPLDPRPARKIVRGKERWEVDLRRWKKTLRYVDVPLRRRFRTLAAARLRIAQARSRRPSTAERSKMTNSLRYRVMRRDQFHCMLCGVTGKEAFLVVDHIMPVSKGGKTILANLQTLCQACNAGKGDSAP
jgi:predicted DNA-binding transcriptional regulator AlpA